MPSLRGAKCAGRNPVLFFGDHVCDDDCDGPRGCIAGKSEEGRFNRIKAAKSLCEQCPVRLNCGTWAVETNQDFGVWGGMTERERKVAKREAKVRGQTVRYYLDTEWNNRKKG